MDTMQLMLSIKNGSLPEDRVSLLKDLFLSPFEITYEEIAAYSAPFRQAYPVPLIKEILRKGDIEGEHIELEIKRSPLTDEEKYLIFLFFKGKVQFLEYENNKYSFNEGENHEQDYDA